MASFELISTLASCLAAALVCGYITHRIGLSPIVGYLVAGFVVGPYTPGVVANTHMADQLAEVGIILLMFGVGLQFHLEELLAVRRVAVPGALVASVVAAILGTLVGRLFGWPWRASALFGISISITSTVVLTRVLAEAGDLQTRTGHVAVGWLVVEDLLTVLVLVLLPPLFGPGHGGIGSVLAAVALAVVKLAAVVALTLVVGERLIPRLLERVAATRSRELFTLTVLVVALGIAFGSAKLFGVSMALGAFLAGMVVGRSEFSLRAATEALPMRDAFAVLFFVSVGMLFDYRHLAEPPGLVGAALLVVLLGKPVAAAAIVFLSGYPLRVALHVGEALAQIGEFSFILAASGRSLGVLDERATNAVVAVALVAISINPILYRLVGRLEPWLRPLVKGPRRLAHTDDETAEAGGQYAAVIVGYGPVGRTLARLLRENNVEPVIIELNLDTVRELTASGIRAVYGDMAHRETLEHAGIRDAVALFLSASSPHGVGEAIRLARELNPRILIVARATYVRELPGLRAAGADIVFSGEGEVALAMTELMLRKLGATPDQLDRERARVHAEIVRVAPNPETLVAERLWAPRPSESENSDADGGEDPPDR